MYTCSITHRATGRGQNIGSKYIMFANQEDVDEFRTAVVNLLVEQRNTFLDRVKDLDELCA